MNNYVEVVTVVPTKKIARKIIKELLNLNLICVAQITKIDSSYWWSGSLVNRIEFRINMKSKVNNFDEINNTIKGIHPYDTFELVSYEMKQGDVRYFNYIEETTHDV